MCYRRGKNAGFQFPSTYMSHLHSNLNGTAEGKRGVQHEVLLSSFLYSVNKHVESEVCQQNNRSF